jgi:hypothetical protein
MLEHVQKDYQLYGRLAWSSTDGLTWVPAEVTDAQGNALDYHTWTPSDVTAWRDGFAATIDCVFDKRGRCHPLKHPLLMSETGESWAVTPWSPPEDVRLRDIVAGDQGLVMVGSGALIKNGHPVWLFTSPDGLTWQGSKAEGIRGYPRGLLLPSWGGYLVAGTSGTYPGEAYLSYSPDGKTWSEHVITLGDQPDVVDLAETSLGLMALVRSQLQDGTYKTALLTSSNGVDWDQKDVEALSGNTFADAMVAADDGVIVLGGGSELASTDGSTWDVRPVEAFGEYPAIVEAATIGPLIVAVSVYQDESRTSAPIVWIGTTPTES